MSNSVFETEEEMDFDAMFNDSLRVAEKQESDYSSYSYENQEKSEPNYQRQAPVETVQEPNQDSDKEEIDEIVEYDDNEDNEYGDNETVSYIEHEENETVEDDVPVSVDRTAENISYQEEENYEYVAPQEKEIEEDQYVAPETKVGIDKSVSLETLNEAFKILDAYRSLESDERLFASLFMELDENALESEIVSSVMNANPLLLTVFDALVTSYELDATEIAFYVVGLPIEVIDGITFVATTYLEDEHIEESERSKKIPYARKAVSLIKKLDSKAIRLIDASRTLIKGEIRDEDAILSNS